MCKVRENKIRSFGLVKNKRKPTKTIAVVKSEMALSGEINLSFLKINLRGREGRLIQVERSQTMGQRLGSL